MRRAPALHDVQHEEDRRGGSHADDDQAPVLHAAIVAAQLLRERVGLHESTELGELLSLMQERVHGDPQRAQELVAVERAHDRALEAGENVAGKVVEPAAVSSPATRAGRTRG